MKRIKECLSLIVDEKMTDDRELETAVGIAFATTDHYPDDRRHEILLKEVYDRLACDLGYKQADELFAKIVAEESKR